MINDEVIWQIINHQATVARERTFCQNPYSVTGLCIRSACPLANSRYATIREEEGVCYLYQKTAERAHSPKNLWEKTRLPNDYTEALELVSKELEHFPKYLVHRNKQRLTKIHQMLIRMRKLKLKIKPKLIVTNKKVEQREKGRERKALKAAQLDKAIEKELLERLKQVSDGEIYNYPEQQYQKVISKTGVEDDDEDEEEVDDENEDELEDEEEDDQGEYDIEYIEDFEESDDEIEETAENIQIPVSTKRNLSETNNNKKNKAKKTRVEVEYEDDDNDQTEKQGQGQEMIFNF